MSKKTKRLEKENLSLTRKHDLTNRNILEMAEERTKVNKEMESIRKRNTTLESLVRKMQEQGRAPPGLDPPLAGEDEGTESEYDEDEEDYEDDGSDDEGDYDDETEDEALQAQNHPPAVHGPHQPNSSSNQTHINGGMRRAVNGKINGVKQELVI